MNTSIKQGVRLEQKEIFEQKETAEQKRELVIENDCDDDELNAQEKGKSIN